ncbi:hypothetical protein KAT51_03670, partial [bacterium]|nr:hypothetical protein [bacterium]
MMRKVLFVAWYLLPKSTFNFLFKSKGRLFEALSTLIMSVLGFFILTSLILKHTPLISFLRLVEKHDPNRVYFQSVVVLLLCLPFILTSKNYFKRILSSTDLTLMDLIPKRVREIILAISIFSPFVLRMFLLLALMVLGAGLFLHLSLLQWGLVLISLILFTSFVKISMVVVAFLWWTPYKQLVYILRILSSGIIGLSFYAIYHQSPLLNFSYAPQTLLNDILFHGLVGASSTIHLIENLLLLFAYLLVAGIALICLSKAINWKSIYEASTSAERLGLKTPPSLSNLSRRLKFLSPLFKKRLRLLVVKDLIQMYLEKRQIMRTFIEVLFLTIVLVITSTAVGVDAVVFAILLLGGITAYRLSSISIARERDSLWILKTSPISMYKILSAKYLTIYLLMLPLSIIILMPFYFFLIVFQSKLL